MKNKITVFVAVVICTFYTQLFGQILPLDSVLNRIEENNPMLKMYDEQINALNNYASGAKSWMPPTVSSGLWQTPYKSIDGGMLMISGEQMIPNPNKLRANANLMNRMGEVELQGKGMKRNELFAAAKDNYNEWIVLKKKYAIVLQTDSLLSSIVALAQLRHTYNKEKLNSVYKAQAELFEVKNMEVMIVQDIKMRNIELDILMNANQTFEFEVDTTVQLKSYEIQITDTASFSSARSDIKQLNANISLMYTKQAIERTKRLPDFGLSLSHMQSLGMMPNSFAAMGMITLPLAPWSNKEYKANIKGIDNTISAMNLQRQSLLNEISGEISALKIQIATSKKQIENYNSKIIPSYYKNYQTSLLSYEQNTEDLFVVLDGLKMYRMAVLTMLDELSTVLKLQTAYERELEIK